MTVFPIIPNLNPGAQALKNILQFYNFKSIRSLAFKLDILKSTVEVSAGYDLSDDREKITPTNKQTEFFLRVYSVPLIFRDSKKEQTHPRKKVT